MTYNVISGRLNPIQSSCSIVT